MCFQAFTEIHPHRLGPSIVSISISEFDSVSVNSRVNPMTRQDKRKWRKLRNQVLSQRDPNQLLDDLLALDRMLVEVSMRIYNVPRRDRFTMRAHNRRLHDAVREHMPRLLKRSRNQS
jgi:hypothetical protein